MFDSDNYPGRQDRFVKYLIRGAITAALIWGTIVAAVTWGMS